MRQRLLRRLRRLRGPRRDSGETLIELMMAIVIMGTAVVAIVGATATAIHLSDIHRRQARAGAQVRAAGEALDNQVVTSAKYVTCAKASDYAALVSGNGATVTGVARWNPSATPPAFVSTSPTCTATDDIGVQRVSLQVQIGSVTEKLDIVIRRPCRPADSDPSCN